MMNIKVTDEAKTELAPIIKENTKKFIRLFIQGFGGGGPRLGIALDEPNDSDEQVNANGIDIIFDKRDKDYFHHTTIDYESSFFGKGFVVRSANASACGGTKD